LILSWLFRDDELHKKVDNLLIHLILMEYKMSLGFDVISAEVEATKGVVASVLVLIDKLVAGVQDAVTLEQAQTFATEFATERQKLADKVAANP